MQNDDPKRPNGKKRSCFFVTPIGSLGSSERRRADNVLDEILVPALSEQFSIVRADQIDDPGSINDDIIRYIYESHLVIADLTGLNSNVMYELGIRHAFNLPIVQIAQNEQKLPFDVASERTIFFDIHDLKDVREAREKIKKAAAAAVNMTHYRGPVIRVLERNALVEQQGEVGNTLSDIADRMSDLETAIQSSGASLYSSIGFDDEVHSKLNHIISYFDFVTPYEFWRIMRELKGKI